jgi:hypothetical protein
VAAKLDQERGRIAAAEGRTRLATAAG